MHTTHPRTPIKSVTIADTTIDLYAQYVRIDGRVVPARDARAAGNEAWRTLRDGGTAAEAIVRAAYRGNRAHYDTCAAINIAAGRCPDGCCGPNGDFPADDTDHPMTIAIDAAHRAYRTVQHGAA
jgi:hypothetical protein